MDKKDTETDIDVVSDLDSELDEASLPPITTQPTSHDDDIPPGLEYLARMTQLILKRVCVMEVSIGIESENMYAVYSSTGQRIFYAAEQTGFMSGLDFESSRPFAIEVWDNSGFPALHIMRPRSLGTILPHCCPCADYLLVESESGPHLGKVRGKVNCCFPGYSILDSSGKKVLNVDGPCCLEVDMSKSQPFKITTTSDKKEVGEVKKQASQREREVVITSDVLAGTFPLDMDVKVKATLLGAILLINFNHFEYSISRRLSLKS